MPQTSLDGLRVIDLTHGSFNYGGRLLAGLGADVVKIESPLGDPVRVMPPFPGDKPDLETSARHLHLNAAKRSVILDLETDQSCEKLRQLIVGADAVIESFDVGYLQERGLGYHDLLKVKPDLVMASITHFGQDGPYANYLGNEIVDVALGGYLKLTGDPDREPVKPYDDLVMTHASLHAATAIMAGLARRDRDGNGDYFDVAAIDAALFLLGGVAQNYHFDRDLLIRRGARLMFVNPNYSYPSTIRPCRDGYVHAHSNNRSPDLLAVLMPDVGLEGLLDTPMGNADEIDAAMDLWMSDKDKFEVVRRAQELRLPFTEVLTPKEILSDAHLESRNFLVEIDHPVAPTTRQPGSPAKFTATPWRVDRAPLLGEHTEEELGGLREIEVGNYLETSSSHGRPLEGIRILELSTAVAGPVAGCVFADMGAEVIKIEAPRARTANSQAPPAIEGVPDLPYNRTPFFNELHRGKSHASIDLNDPRGRELFLKLVKTADVVLENFAPRVLSNLDIEYETLKQENSGIILVSMPAFGKSGPYAMRSSYGPGIDAMSGMSHLTGYPDRGPGKPAQFYLDQNAGLTAALTTMAALRHRRLSGEGQCIELSMLEGELQLVAPALMDVTMNNRTQSRIGNRHAWHAPQGVYRCAGDDAWVAIGIENDDQWHRLRTVIDHDGLIDNPIYADASKRYENHGQIDLLIQQWTLERTHIEAMHELQAAGVPAGAVLNIAEVFEDPQFLQRETLAWVDHPEMGRFPHTRTAWRSLHGNHGVTGPAPSFGGSNSEVLNLAGYDEESRLSLIDGGIVATEPRGGT